MIKIDPLKYQPIPIIGLHDKYCIEVRKGYVYEIMEDEIKEVPTYKNDEGYVCVDLTYPDGKVLKAPIEELMIRVLYGPVNCGSIRHVYELPCDDKGLSPLIRSLEMKSDDLIIINGIKYKRYKDTYAYISKEGAVFSLLMGQFYRINYNDRGYAKVNFKVGEKTKEMKVHRLVWMTYVEDLNISQEIDHANKCRWDNRLENLRKKCYVGAD